MLKTFSNEGSFEPIQTISGMLSYEIMKKIEWERTSTLEFFVQKSSKLDKTHNDNKFHFILKMKVESYCMYF